MEQVKDGWMTQRLHVAQVVRTILQAAHYLPERRKIHVIEPFRQIDMCGMGSEAFDSAPHGYPTATSLSALWREERFSGLDAQSVEALRRAGHSLDIITAFQHPRME
jgi:hypothetical protein